MRNNEIIEFNKRLSDKYGRDVSLDQPNYRIVWSSDEIEVRKGTYHDYNGDIFLRTITETRATEKYPLFPNMWVLEVLQGCENNPELVAKYSYEPLHIFGANNSNRRPEWDKVVILVHAHRYIQRQIKSASDFQDDEDKRFLAERERHLAILREDTSAFYGALRDGDAVVVQSDHLKPKE